LVAYYPPLDAAYTCGTVSVLMDRERMKNQPDWWTTHEKEGEEEARHQICLLRCIFGNPFRPVTIPPAVLAWNDRTIPKLADAIYEERTFHHLPILVEALEQAGCHNEDILKHCKQPGEHVRGCCVVDLLLGKE
jgi:hypothetical protein